MTTTAARRQFEVNKYPRAYKHPNYRMGDARRRHAQAIVTGFDVRGSYLDVGCGRGEMLKHARALGFERVQGTEVVPSLYEAPDVIMAMAHDLPFDDGEFEVVTCLDVLEHLLPEDTEIVLAELDRVASKHVVVTANNKSSRSLGMELHVNRRPYDEWDQIITDTLAGSVEWVARGVNISETWVTTRD